MLDNHDDSSVTINTNSQIKFKVTKLKSSFCYYVDPYILVKRTITVAGEGSTESEKATDRNNKQASKIVHRLLTA